MKQQKHTNLTQVGLAIAAIAVLTGFLYPTGHRIYRSLYCYFRDPGPEHIHLGDKRVLPELNLR